MLIIDALGGGCADAKKTDDKDKSKDDKDKSKDDKDKAKAADDKDKAKDDKDSAKDNKDKPKEKEAEDKSKAADDAKKAPESDAKKADAPKKPKAKKPAASAEPPATWKCSVCTLENAWANSSCDACASPKPADAGAAGADSGAESGSESDDEAKSDAKGKDSKAKDSKDEKKAADTKKAPAKAKKEHMTMKQRQQLSDWIVLNEKTLKRTLELKKATKSLLVFAYASSVSIDMCLDVLAAKEGKLSAALDLILTEQTSNVCDVLPLPCVSVCSANSHVLRCDVCSWRSTRTCAPN